LFDTDGNCVWQAEHELWGRSEVAFAKKTDNYQPLVDCSLRFQNQWEDRETGLYYNLNRYYDPDSGQYLSTDPIGLEGGLRTHGYVHDPMQWVDPMGLADVCPKGDKWTKKNGDIKWPPRRGFDGKTKTITLKPGTRIDRYGYEGGTFASPEGTPYSNRALAPGTQTKPHNIYEVNKPVKVKAGKIAPWFDEPGGGTQYEFDKSISQLLKEEILIKVGS
jgi:RHS repeat-associated protein